jgi:hypothetical protein
MEERRYFDEQRTKVQPTTIYPLPVAPPEPQPESQPAPQKRQRNPNTYRILSRVGSFLTAVVLLTAFWLVPAMTVGMTAYLWLDISLYVLGILHMFWALVLTDAGFRFAERYCTFWK